MTRQFAEFVRIFAENPPGLSANEDESGEYASDLPFFEGFFAIFS